MNCKTYVLIVIFTCRCLFGAEKKEVQFGGFLDTYYGFDFNEPSSDRNFTTQAIRHNEFALNLAYLEARIERERVHGRLALQAGTSVYANYSGERRYGTGNSQLADILQHVQEAYGGYRVNEQTWIDAGIFFSHIGAEGFISKDNWNYTRSLGADFSPYYQTGMRLNHQWNPQWLASLQVLNGWQNLIETNGDKALGMQLAYAPSDRWSLTYNNFIGREQELRIFNQIILKVKISRNWSLAFSSDLGMQKKGPGMGYSLWYVETLLTQLRLSDTIAVGGRIEYFHDQDQVIVSTQTPSGFQTYGASINLDWQPETYFLARAELRSLVSRDSIFASSSTPRTSNTLLVGSFALTF